MSFKPKDVVTVTRRLRYMPITFYLEDCELSLHAAPPPGFFDKIKESLRKHNLIAGSWVVLPKGLQLEVQPSSPFDYQLLTKIKNTKYLYFQFGHYGDDGPHWRWLRGANGERHE